MVDDEEILNGDLDFFYVMCLELYLIFPMIKTRILVFLYASTNTQEFL